MIDKEKENETKFNESEEGDKNEKVNNEISKEDINI